MSAVDTKNLREWHAAAKQRGKKWLTVLTADITTLLSAYERCERLEALLRDITVAAEYLQKPDADQNDSAMLFSAIHRGRAALTGEGGE